MSEQCFDFVGSQEPPRAVKKGERVRMGQWVTLEKKNTLTTRVAQAQSPIVQKT